jgi:hypothetical protein
MLHSSRRFTRLSLAVLVAGLFFAKLACPWAAGQNSHVGPVTGVIDGVAFEGDQYYVHGWACQEGNRGSDLRSPEHLTITILELQAQLERDHTWRAVTAQPNSE